MDNFNEWLLHDRINIIADVCSRSMYYELLLCNGCSDVIMKLMQLAEIKMKRLGVNTNKRRTSDDDMVTYITDDCSFGIDCAEKDEHGNVIKFHPLRAVNNEWIEWFREEYKDVK